MQPGRADLPVDVLFGLVVPPAKSALDFEQDLYLLWPGEIATTVSGPAERALRTDVETQGFVVAREGRVELVARQVYGRTTAGQVIPGGGSFVTVTREAGALGQTAPATLIRIPWTPYAANPAFLVDVRFSATGLVKRQPAPWINRTFSGARHVLALGFNDVGGPTMFAMYFPRRDRLLRVTDPARLIVNFASADRLGIDQVSPESARAESSQIRRNTQTVSLFLRPFEGLSPQVLTVRFGYFSRLQSWGPILIPTLFFALGNIAAVVVRSLTERVRQRLASRMRIGRKSTHPWVRQTGTIVPRDRLATLVPGESRYEDVLRLVGPEPEEQESLATPGRKVLVYRGERTVPVRKWHWGWLAAIHRWDVERHHVEIVVEDGVVRDIQASVRRARLPNPTST